MTFRHAPLPLALLLAALPSCGAETPPPEAPPPAPAPTPAPVSAPAPAPAAEAKPLGYEPGGMWMPEQLAQKADTLKGLGAADPAAFADPRSSVLGAVVSLEGCSASFVSDEGLVITNHHCVVRALQLNSKPSDNLIRDGFLAKTRAEERWAGPSARILVTQSLRDVTKEVVDGLVAIKDDLAREKKVEERTKALVAACEKGRPGIRCNVAEFFGGAAYRLIEQVEIKDVRLVFAPHDQIGDYGGEVDNWHWPRHTGDVGMLRAYVGKDGKPAEHAEGNVPYRPPFHLKPATQPLAEGDLVFVAGYPGATNRLRTAAETEEAVGFTYPHRIAWCDENIALLDQLRLKNEDIKLKATPLWRGLNNYRTKMKGIMDGLVQGGLKEQKAKLDAEVQAWTEADPARKAAHGDVIGKMKAKVDERRATRAHDAEIAVFHRLSTLYNSAAAIVHMAEERDKPDAERDPAYQERNWERLAQAEQTFTKRYDRTVDEALLKLALQRMERLPPAERPEIFDLVVGKDARKGPKVSDERLGTAIDALYQKTTLEDEKTRLDLLKKARTKDLAKSKDPLIALALAMRPVHKALEEREKAFNGAMHLLRPRYVEAIQKMSPHPIAPDANGTLRVTFGTVRGYRPAPEAGVFRPFTTVSEMVKKNKGVWPFDAPGYLLETVKAKKFGPYVDARLGEIPVDFLSDVDITGGNSGSATINGRGEIVGLAFDGNYEAMASDWLFQPSITRTIHVDLRYVEWLLDAVVPGHHLLQEMGYKPAFP